MDSELDFYLIINAAATFRTFGHFSNAITVNKLPQIPITIIKIVAIAAKLSNGRPNLKMKYKCHLMKLVYFDNKITKESAK